MSDFFFPSIPENAVLPIKTALLQMAANPGYLSAADCPYSPALVTFLTELTTSGDAADAPTEFDRAPDKLVYIEAEIGRVIQDLNNLQNSLGKADHTDKLAVAKAKTGLIEKLIGYRERVVNAREMTQFVGRIIQFLEDVCDKDQITALKERLRGLESLGDHK